MSIGKVTIAASGARPRPDTAFFMTPTKSARVSVTVGMPCVSILAAARPHAVAQDPQAALPMMTASTPLFLTSFAVSSSPISALPCGNASIGKHFDARKILLEQLFEHRQHAKRLPLLVGDDADALAVERVEARRVRLRDFEPPDGS